MTTFPMESPPRAPGLYELRHRTNGLIYIGKSVDLHRRYQEWRVVFTSGLGHKNKHLAKAMTNPSDWTFNVVAVVLDEAALGPREATAIAEAAERAPELLLNIMLPDNTNKRTISSAPGSTITEGCGEISYSDAAERLGCTRTTLAKRLYKYRQRGQTTVTYEQLRLMSEKWAKNSGTPNPS